jgi:DNA-3-methyladenine glycosylase
VARHAPHSFREDTLPVASLLRVPSLTGTELLPRKFFARPAVQVAPDLLGCVLVHQTAEGLVAVRLTEVEAYAGEADPASHAFRGRTARNAVMYGPPGHAYVYFTYGMHFCVNLVCEGDGDPSAVLLRAGLVIDGAALASARRYGTAGGPGADGREGVHQSRARRTVPREIDLARGPARLCEALGIDRAQNGADACAPGSPLRVYPAQAPVPAADISAGPRVGVSRAADVAWRFWITDDPAVSVYRAYAPRRARAKPVTIQGPEDGTMPP